MMLNSWMIKSWPIVDCPIDVSSELRKALTHMGTHLSQEPDEDGCTVGHTLWAVEEDGQQFGVAWDWTEMMPGVPVLTDPMRLLTNLAFIADDGTIATESRCAVELNRIVRALPWQLEVCREIKSHRGVKPVARTASSRRPHPSSSPRALRASHLSF